MRRVRRATLLGSPLLFCLVLLAHLHAQDKGTILFVGSSIFHRWTQLERDMAPLPVTNIAFDGAVTDDWNRLIDSRVIPAKPKVIAYYCGSNDVDAGDSATHIVARIRQFIDRVTKALPDTEIVFVSVNKAPEKRDRWDVVDDINRQIEKYGEKNTRVQYVDVNPVLLNADGTSRMELFMNDRLHLRPPAYEGFTKILKPVLERALSRSP
ncbi:MAG TPA: GDSL-type esterase/lipase family protein [Vicinamibacterales bacterium]|nr:GDSL-type esterase/lipase family protein [Vicinamibacterales bacterium]